MRAPITVILNFGLDTHSLDHIKLIERLLDQSLISAGYARSESSKGGGSVMFDYRQIAIIEG
jgi:hypothetical protein